MINFDNIINSIPEKESSNVTVEHISPIHHFKNQICFIDGGNAEIISSPEYSIQFIKIVALLIKNNQIFKIIKEQEFYCLQSSNEGFIIKRINPDSKKNEITNHENLNNLTDSFLLKTGKEITEAGNILRNYLEFKLCNNIQNQFNHDNNHTSNVNKENSDFSKENPKFLIVKDGCLQPKHKLEINELSKIQNICGLSKTSKELQNNKSLITKLNSIKGTWFLQDDQDKNKFIIKLNKNSTYAFKTELKNLNIKNVLQELISNSNDYTYPGYPYGLMMVDQLARVSNKEVSSLRILFEIKLGQKWKKVINLENSINAHKILDNLIF